MESAIEAISSFGVLLLVRNQVVLTSVAYSDEQGTNWLRHIREYLKSDSSPPPYK